MVNCAGPVTTFVFLTLPLAPGAVKARAKDRDDVSGKFSPWGVSVVCFHDDFCVVLLEQLLEQIVCDTAESVLVGNRHDS